MWWREERFEFHPAQKNSLVLLIALRVLSLQVNYIKIRSLVEKKDADGYRNNAEFNWILWKIKIVLRF